MNNSEILKYLKQYQLNCENSLKGYTKSNINSQALIQEYTLNNIEAKIECNWKPILIPLNSENLEKEIYINNDFVTTYEYLELDKYLNINTFSKTLYWIDSLPYKIVRELLKLKFDVFSLINKDIAISLYSDELKGKNVYTF